MVYSISISVRLRVSNYPPFLLFLTNSSFTLLFLLLYFWHSFGKKKVT